MDVVHARVAGLDVHKRSVQVCVLQSGPAGTVERTDRSYATMIDDLTALATWLVEQGVTHVVMEATGVYWKSVYNVLESAADFAAVLVVNPEHIKAVTGRKTDRADAARLAFLLRHDLLVGSYIPERSQRELRDVVRSRTALIRERARTVQRLEKALEAANIKLGAVLSELLGVSGQAMLDAVLAGELDPQEIVQLAHPKLATKRADLERALVAPLSPLARFLVAQHLDHWRELEARIGTFDTAIAQALADETELIERLDAVPGIGRRTAEIIVTEIGSSVERFPTARHLAAWAGVAPGNRESAGKQKRARTRRGNAWLKSALTEAAWAAVRCKSGYLPAQYGRLAGRRGRKRAIVAVAHTLVHIVYRMIATGSSYQDLGGDYFEQRDRDGAERRAVATLKKLGYRVELHPTVREPEVTSVS
jgi:transposase